MRSRWARRLGTLMSLSLALSVFAVATAGIQPVSAYNGTGAASAADTYWNWENTGNVPSPYFWNHGVDCANFASVMMQKGGGFANSPSASPPWFYNNSSPTGYSESWIKASTLYTFLMNYSPGGILVATTSGNVVPGYNNLNKGDLVFFNWGGTSTSGITHVAMEVGWPTYVDDASHTTKVGDYIDQHTNARWHQAWNAYYLNLQRATTTVFQVQILPNN